MKKKLNRWFLFARCWLILNFFSRLFYFIQWMFYRFSNTYYINQFLLSAHWIKINGLMKTKNVHFITFWFDSVWIVFTSSSPFSSPFLLLFFNQSSSANHTLCMVVTSFFHSIWFQFFLKKSQIDFWFYVLHQNKYATRLCACWNFFYSSSQQSAEKLLPCCKECLFLMDFSADERQTEKNRINIVCEYHRRSVQHCIICV